MKRILAPVDFSPVTEAVVATVEIIAKACQSKIFLIHVAPELDPALKNVQVPQHDRDTVAHMLRKEHRDLQGFAENLTEHQCDAEALMVEGHGTVEKILDEAHSLQVDLIVLGSHGHGKLHHMLLGSTSEGILRKTSIPVLIVPTIHSEKKEHD